MFPIFELAKLISYRHGPKATEATANNSKLICHAYKNTGSKHTLCLFFTNGRLLLWQQILSHSPSAVWLPWLQKVQIQIMCLDPTACWLLTLSIKNQVHVVPVGSVLTPEVTVDRLFNHKDITEVKVRARIKGSVTSMLWWKSMLGDEIAVIANKAGYLTFIGLSDGRELHRVDVNEYIINMELVCNDNYTYTYLLLSCKSGSQWQLIVEEKITKVKDTKVKDTKVKSTKFKGMSLNIETIVTHNRDGRPLFEAQRLERSSSPCVQLTSQYAKGRHLLGAHDVERCSLTVYPCDLGGCRPLYCYRLPAGVSDLVYTDTMIFTVSRDGTDTTLNILANQLQEGQGTSPPQVMQQFTFEPSEQLIAVVKKSYPFNWFQVQRQLRTSTNSSSKVSTSTNSRSEVRISTNSNLEVQKPTMSLRDTQKSKHSSGRLNMSQSRCSDQSSDCMITSITSLDDAQTQVRASDDSSDGSKMDSLVDSSLDPYHSPVYSSVEESALVELFLCSECVNTPTERPNVDFDSHSIDSHNTGSDSTASASVLPASVLPASTAPASVLPDSTAPAAECTKDLLFQTTSECTNASPSTVENMVNTPDMTDFTWIQTLSTSSPDPQIRTLSTGSNPDPLVSTLTSDGDICPLSLILSSKSLTGDEIGAKSLSSDVQGVKSLLTTHLKTEDQGIPVGANRTSSTPTTSTASRSNVSRYRRDACINRMDGRGTNSLTGWDDTSGPSSHHRSRESSRSMEEIKQELKEFKNTLDKTRVKSKVAGDLVTGGKVMASVEDLYDCVSKHTVLDGCLLISNKAVYECRPRVSPELYFMELGLQEVAVEDLQLLSRTTEINFRQLCWQLAKILVEKRRTAYAIKVLKLGQFSLLDLSLMLLLVDNTSDFILSAESYLSQKSMDDCVSVDVRKGDLVTGLVRAYAQTAVRTGKQAWLDKLSHLIYSEIELIGSEIWTSLQTIGLQDQEIWHLAKSSGRISEILDLYDSTGRLGWLTSDLCTDLHTDEAAAHDLLTGGATMSLLTPDDLVNILDLHPAQLGSVVRVLCPLLPSLPVQTLQRLCHRLDPSTSLMRGHLHRLLRLPTVLADKNKTALAEVQTLLQGFVHCALHLHSVTAPEIPSHHLLCPDTKNKVCSDKVTQVLSYRLSPLSATGQRTTIIDNQQVYIWHRTDTHRLAAEDCLGVGERRVKLSVVHFPIRGIRALSVSSGNKHTLVITSAGVYSWGDNRHGQLGVGDRLPGQQRPLLVKSLRDKQVVKVECGAYHSLALTENGRALSWGWGVHGQLGHGCTDDALDPVEVSDLSSHFLVSLTAGYAHSGFLTAQGSVWLCGNNSFGQCGLASSQKETRPIRLQGISEPVLHLSGRYYHTVAVTKSGSLYVWGTSPSDRKTAPPPNYQTPQTVDTTAVHGRIAQVHSGSCCNVLLTRDGQIYSWGRNLDGQLGHGHRKDQTAPHVLVQLSDQVMTDVSCGPDYVVAMDTEGQVWGWGRNDQGQLLVRAPDESSQSVVYRRGSVSRTEVTMSVLTPVVLNLDGGRPVNTRSVIGSVLRLESERKAVDSVRGATYPQKEWTMTPLDRERDGVRTLPALSEKSCRRGCAGGVRCCFTASAIDYCLGSGLLPPAPLLPLCLDLQLPLATAVVCKHLGRVGDAAKWFLKAVRKVSPVEPSLVVSVRKVLEHTVCVLREESDTKEAYTTTTTEVLQELFSLWLSHDLPVSQLEDILLPSLTYIAYPCFSYINSLQLTNKEPDFSSTFQLRLLQLVLATLREGRDLDLVTYIPGSLTPSTHPVSPDRLWNSITENIRQNITTRGCILLSNQQLRLLGMSAVEKAEPSPSHLVSSLLDPAGGRLADCGRLTAVLFTCGHHFTWKAFMASLEAEPVRVGGVTSLQAVPGLAGRLYNYYQGRSYQWACPDCLKKALGMGQTYGGAL